MALLTREIPETPRAKEPADTNRILTRDNLTAAERKNIKVSPEAFKAIKSMALMNSKKLYIFIDEMINHYMDTKLTEREKRMLKELLKESD